MTTSSVQTRAIPIEQVISLNPFVVRRRIAFRDCDPAGIVFTPKFLDPIALSAWELFMAELVGGYGNRDAEIAGLDTPAKAVSLVFHHPVKYGELIDTEVFCSKIGNTTFESTVAGRSLEGLPLFDCSFTALCINQPGFQRIEVPGYLRDKLQPYIKQ